MAKQKSSGWLDKYQKGGTVPATKQDSLNLYNNATNVLNYYNNKKHTKGRTHYDTTPNFTDNRYSTNESALKYFRTLSKENGKPSIVPLVSGKSASTALPESTYYKKLDDNRYMQREEAFTILDTRAPMQLFDKRIAPTVSQSFINTDSKDPLYGDLVSMNGYDPILVKPISMLTPQERALRIERYGEASGIPNIKSKVKPKSKLINLDARFDKGRHTILQNFQYSNPTPQSTIDWMEGNGYSQDFVPELEQLKQVQTPNYGEVNDPRTGYTHMTRDGSPMYPLVGHEKPEMAMGGKIPNDNSLDKYQDGGGIKRFMQPTETFKNLGYNTKAKDLSTEYSTSVGGPGEVYLVPSFRQGKLLNDPEGVFNTYGEHLGGPFKTWQNAEKFQELRHKYVEQNKDIPAPFKTRDYKLGGTIPNDNWLDKYQDGGIIKDDRGQWDHPGEITEIGSNQITMQGVPYPVLGVSDTGDTQMMYPNQEYKYKGKSVTEYPMMQNGNKEIKQKGGWLNKYK